MRGKPFWAMCCPVNVYCDRDISCIVTVTYHVLISAQLVSYVVSILCNLISLWVWHYHRIVNRQKGHSCRYLCCFRGTDSYSTIT